MMRISVFKHSAELTDTFLSQMVALGADCIDFGRDADMPGVSEQGFPDLDGVIQLRKRLRSFGIDVNRVTLPNMTERFMNDEAGAQAELENTCQALRVFGEAGIPIARQRFEGDVFSDQMYRYESVHRGGYRSRGESLGLMKDRPVTPTKAELDNWWDHFRRVFDKLVPIAEE